MKTIQYAFQTTFTLFLFSFLLMGFGAKQTTAQVKSSKISFIETKHDFGKVKQGVELAYEYKFKSEGKDTLAIKNVRAGCGCTGVTIGEKKKFGTGEEGGIKVTFNTNRRSGIQNKTVSVLTNDPANPNVMLSFTCDIVTK